MNRFFAILVLALVGFDQLTKWLAESHLPFHQAVDIIPFFSLYLTYNTGVAFSFLSDVGPAALIAMTLVIIAIMLWLWYRLPAEQQLASLGFALIVSGACGNLIDRLTQGHVIDFFLFHTQTWAFAVFNVADSYITLGAAAIIIEELLALRSKPRNSESEH